MFRKKFFVNVILHVIIVTLMLSVLSSCKKKSGETNAESTEMPLNPGSFLEGNGEGGERFDGYCIAPEDVSVLLESFNDDKMFSERDRVVDFDENTATFITLADGGSVSSSDKVTIDGDVITVAEEGTYVFRGSLSNGQIIVNTPKESKLQFVFDGVNITSVGSAPLYVKQTDKLFVTLKEGSVNELTQSGEFVAIDENNIDATVFSKEDITFNGNGSLNIVSEKGHGIVSKDDLVFVSGTYSITAARHALAGKDSVRILDGTFGLNSVEDGIHSENDEDESLGYIYISGGLFDLECADDGIHAGANVVICNGTININKSYEGIEGRAIDITGGTVNVVSEDDGFNATDGSGGDFGMMGPGGMGDITTFPERPGGRFPKDAEMPNTVVNAEEAAPENNMSSLPLYIRFSGGKITVDAGGDGLDSNGALYVTGGEIYVYGPSNNGNGALDYLSDASISGGVFFAVGQTGMAMNFRDASNQCSVMVSLSGVANEELRVTNASGTVIAFCNPVKSYTSVVVSCPGMNEGETINVSAGAQSVSVSLESAVVGESAMGGMGNFPGGDIGGGKPNHGTKPFR